MHYRRWHKKGIKSRNLLPIIFQIKITVYITEYGKKGKKEKVTQYTKTQKQFSLPN